MSDNQEPISIRLQGIGWVAAKPASELQPGDRTIWNFGYVYIVNSIGPSTSGKTLEAELRAESNGETWSRRFKPTRLVGFVSD